MATRSGLAVAMKASFDKNASLGFSSGIGGDAALAAALARRPLKVVAAPLEEEEGEAIETGIWGERARIIFVEFLGGFLGI